ncbi:hypothetical protein DB346_10350 [Verrucomicrobia bacterium LW23]|nr:hypothetical protein DB346_10350 [Verrucomicrobia bacterium LW23]
MVTYKSRIKKAPPWAGYLALSLFGLFWTSFVVVSDVVVVGKIYRQLRTYGFSPVPATVLSNEVGFKNTSDGTSYFPKIRYAYTVNNQPFTGDVVRHTVVSTESKNARQRVHDFVKAYPRESTIIAFYDPANPADAVVMQGLTGSDLFILLFLMPFNMVMLAFVWLAWSLLYKARQPLGGLPHHVGPHGFMVGVGRRGAFASGAVTLGLVSFLAIFGVGFSSGFDPSLNTMLGVWGVVLSLTLASAGYAVYLDYTGVYDLEADYLHQTLIIPATKQSPARRTFALHDPQSVILRTVHSYDSDNDKTTSYNVEFRMHETAETVLVGNITMEETAEALARWLADHMRLPLEETRPVA